MLNLFRFEPHQLNSDIPLAIDNEILKEAVINTDFGTFKLEDETNDLGYLIKLKNGNKEVGALTLSLADIQFETAQLHFFLVKKHRHQGLEEQLLEAAFNWLRSESKFREITVDVSTNATVERKILVKYGFTAQSADNETKRKKRSVRLVKVIRK